MEFGSGDWRARLERFWWGHNTHYLWASTAVMPEEVQEIAREAILKTLNRAKAWHLFSWCQDSATGYCSQPVTATRPVEGSLVWVEMQRGLFGVIDSDALLKHLGVEPDCLNLPKSIQGVLHERLHVATGRFLRGEPDPGHQPHLEGRWETVPGSWTFQLHFRKRSRRRYHMWCLASSSVASYIANRPYPFGDSLPAEESWEPQLSLITCLHGLGMDPQFVLHGDSADDLDVAELLAIEDDTALMRMIHEDELNRYLPISGNHTGPHPTLLSGDPFLSALREAATEPQST